MATAIPSDTSQESVILAFFAEMTELEIGTEQTPEQAIQHPGSLQTEADATSTPPRPSSNVSQDLDYLTSLPSELLIKIISYVPSTCFHDIVHTSRSLRQFVRSNAAAICNMVIRSRYPLESKLLKTELVSGWLVPTHQKIKDQENTHKQEAFESNKRWVFTRFRYFSLLGDRQSEETDNFMAISGPGPLFLLFLQDGLFHAEPYGQACHRNLKSSTGSTGWKEVTEGTEYFCWFHDDFELNCGVLLGTFNEVWLDVGNGRVQASTGAFDKELIWYYGVGGLEGHLSEAFRPREIKVSHFT